MSFESNNESIQFPEIALEIKRMIDADQSMREQNHLDPTDTFWDETVDQQNTARMKEIVAQIGFPTISRVGKEASEAAWLLVQHADHDVAFQAECLRLMKEADVDDIDKISIAYLEDRVRVNQGQEQLYGTQFLQKDGKHIPRPIFDEEHVDERRTEIGLDTMAERIKEMYERYPFKE